LNIMNQKGLDVTDLHCPHLPSLREHSFVE
jgi:hypothetical protein